VRTVPRYAPGIGGYPAARRLDNHTFIVASMVSRRTGWLLAELVCCPLRERLFMEIAQFPAADRGRAQDALALASQLHAQGPAAARTVCQPPAQGYDPDPRALLGQRP
jgi:hypothetical protein